MELAWFVGVDWGSQTHQACVIDVAGTLFGERAFEHGGQGLSEMADWVLSVAAGAADQVGVAIETPRGPVVESLMERGLACHAINPKQRDRLSPAGAKDDRRDAGRSTITRGVPGSPAGVRAVTKNRPRERLRTPPSSAGSGGTQTPLSLSVRRAPRVRSSSSTEVSPIATRR